MTSSKSIIVVAPRCPAGLILELPKATINPIDTDVYVLLPPEDSHQYNHLLDGDILIGQVKLLPSPARSFFSKRHLLWLHANLWSSRDNKLLIYRSPYQDPATALVSLFVMILSGSTITLLFATPEAIIQTNGHGFSEKWISKRLSWKILGKEFITIVFFMIPWFIIYLIMFWGLFARRFLSKDFSALSQSS